MDKKCIFCGGKPQNKNKEHIVPQWLIKFTGDSNRTFHLGTEWIESSSLRSYSADQFHFPACQKCNEKHSDFESAASIIIHKLFNVSKIAPKDIDLLLDWFDKVRIGFWLGYLYLEKDYVDIDPKFYIDSRMGRSDRVLFVYHLSDDLRGLTFSGINSPIFFHMPSCFSLRIKSLLFINISNAFLISRRVGFPYPQKVVFNDSEGIHIEIGEPLRRIIKPILKYQFREPEYAFFQPIIPLVTEMDKETKLKDEFLQNHMLNVETGKGQIIFSNDSFCEWLSDGDEFELRLDHNAISHEKSLAVMKKITMQIYDFQLRLYDDNIIIKPGSITDKEKKKRIQNIHNVKKLQNLLIDKMKKIPPEKFFRSKNDILK
jgi:hypothetical protein